MAYNPILGFAEGHTVRHRSEELVGRYDPKRADAAGRRGDVNGTGNARHGARAVPARRAVSHTSGPCWEAITHLQLRKSHKQDCACKLESAKSAPEDNVQQPATEQSQARSKAAAKGHVESLFQREAQRRKRLEAKRALRQQQLLGDFLTRAPGSSPDCASLVYVQQLRPQLRHLHRRGGGKTPFAGGAREQ